MSTPSYGNVYLKIGNLTVDDANSKHNFIDCQEAALKIHWLVFQRAIYYLVLWKSNQPGV